MININSYSLIVFIVFFPLCKSIELSIMYFGFTSSTVTITTNVHVSVVIRALCGFQMRNAARSD